MTDVSVAERLAPKVAQAIMERFANVDPRPGHVLWHSHFVGVAASKEEFEAGANLLIEQGYLEAEGKGRMGDRGGLRLTKAGWEAFQEEDGRSIGFTGLRRHHNRGQQVAHRPGLQSGSRPPSPGSCV